MKWKAETMNCMICASIPGTLPCRKLMAFDLGTRWDR